MIDRVQARKELIANLDRHKSRISVILEYLNHEIETLKKQKETYNQEIISILNEIDKIEKMEE